MVMSRRRLGFRPTPDVKLFLPGAMLLAGAVIGGGFKAAGTEVPLIGSVLRQVLLGAVGLVVMAASWVKLHDSSPADAGDHTKRGPAGAKVVVDNVPHRPSRMFRGRDDLLARLSDVLAREHVVALSGLGGIGKTQVALAYATSPDAARCQLRWWLRADTAENLAADLAALAKRLGLAEAGRRHQSEAVAAADNWLQSHDNWLVIFDNAADADLIRPYLPKREGGDVVITSRSPFPRTDAHPFPVPVLSADAAQKFLVERSGDTDQASAAGIADALGCLPLALEQAGAYVEQQGTLAGYLKKLTAQDPSLLAASAPRDYQHSVATTWAVSFRQVAESSKAAAELMRLCAYLAADEIPLVLLADSIGTQAAALHEAAARGQLDETAALLARYSLVERLPGGAVSVHRLVQSVVRADLATPEQRRWAGVAAAAVRTVFPADSGDTASWPRCRQLLSHALAASGHSEQLGVEPDATTSLLNRAGTYLQSRVDLAGARAAFERALAIDETAYGPNHTEVAIDVNNLAGVLRDLGDLAGARAGFERALAIDETAYGPNHTAVARDVNNLALVLQALGETGRG